MQIFTNNLGTLLTGALFELVAACIGLLLGGIKQFLALFFPSLNGWHNDLNFYIYKHESGISH